VPSQQALARFAVLFEVLLRAVAIAFTRRVATRVRFMRRALTDRGKIRPRVGGLFRIPNPFSIQRQLLGGSRSWVSSGIIPAPRASIAWAVRSLYKQNETVLFIYNMQRRY
jgi:hypothetical protein